MFVAKVISKTLDAVVSCPGESRTKLGSTLYILFEFVYILVPHTGRRPG